MTIISKDIFQTHLVFISHISISDLQASELLPELLNLILKVGNFLNYVSLTFFALLGICLECYVNPENDLMLPCYVTIMVEEKNESYVNREFSFYKMMNFLCLPFLRIQV